MSMTDQQELAALRNAQEQARSARARAEADVDAARASAERAKAALQTEFGVSTSEEISALVGTLDKELADALSEARSELERTQA